MKGNALFLKNPAGGYPTIVRGEGIHLYDDEGRRYIDGTAGASNVTLGHGRRDIAGVMGEQAATLAYAFSVHFENKPARDLAERLISRMGEIDACLHTHPHHVLGHFTPAEWLRFLHLHHRHHDAIIRDILA